ncbi:probable isoaspartyl peptidase/L-asparaginase GA20639 [Musca vetustissima]|uniref:probable isoaspartyl peptidase/L-asparaginase GA20639 n=1 Tax=Musca vetustissima TaxID=27455 RepID=UPI002AB641B0|nr:probable isoaspartyl peptidase/L-asparaginase GA20639 [Musca vetustissima]
MSIEPILLIHGGAGDITDARVPGKLVGMKKALRSAIEHLIPPNGGEGNALDAVEAAVRSMECDENFNAGYGACLNLDGKAEVEASIMEGDKLRAGCVTLLHDIMHPISVARYVMHKTNHTFLGGAAAQKFALEQGFEQLPDGSLVTDDARRALEEFKERQAKGLDTIFSRTELDAEKSTKDEGKQRVGESGSTVGAVAIDAKGNIAVATSTGGITGKVPGRIGDTPLLGCGTYADNKIGGVSTTGHGETIMRYNLAQKILGKIQYGNKTAQEATEEACNEMTERLVGTGGAITIDATGKVGIYWTSRRMAYAYVKGNRLFSGINKNEQFEEDL